MSFTGEVLHHIRLSEMMDNVRFFFAQISDVITYRRLFCVLHGRRNGHSRVEEWNQRGLERMVEIGLARPDRADHAIVAVKLVEP